MGGQGSLRKCLCCTSVWHEECLGNTGAEVCPTCLHEQVEAGEESKRWAGCLKTQIDRPRPPAAKTCSQEVIDQDNLQDLGPSHHATHDRHDSWCRGCDQGGDLLCCDHCTLVWHLECVYPAISKVPEGKWACPHCAAKGKPKPKSQGAPRSKPAKRKSSTNASLLEMVPGGLSFKQQLQLAMSESKRDEEAQQRQRKSQRSPPPAMMPQSSNLKSRQPVRYMLLGASSLPKKRRLNKPKEIQQMSSNFKSDTVQPSNDLDLPRHPQSPTESMALSDALSQDTVEEDFGLGEFIIHEAADKVELDSFSICASNEAP